MVSDRLFATIDDMYEEYLGVWEDVGNIESPTEYKHGVDKVGKYFVEMAQKRGWLVEVFNQQVSGDVVCITLNPEAKGRAVTFSGHIDTVHAVGAFGQPAVRCDENNIYGPGVTDCKGGVVAAFMAMDALDKIGFNSRPVSLLLQSDEEVHSMSSNKETINYICQKAKDSIAFLNCEPTRGNSVVLMRKGVVYYKFIIKGKEIHSSRCKDGASAILEAAHKIIELEKLKDADGITCNCGIISGGNVANTVPARCEFVADFRFSTYEELEWIKSYVEDVAKNSTVSNCKCELEQICYRPAMELTKKNVDLLNRINTIYKENGLPELEYRKSLGGSDAADVTVFGIPCVDSIGVAGDFIHTINEYGVKKSLSEAAKRLAVVAFLLQ